MDAIFAKYQTKPAEVKPADATPAEYDYNWSPSTKIASAVPDGALGSESNPEDVTNEGIAKFSAKTAGENANAADKVKAALVEAVTAGQRPWESGWNPSKNPGGSLPRNPASKSLYSGSNRTILKMVAEANDYKDPRWMTFKQANDLGGSVRKGEKGTMILVPRSFMVKDKNSSDPDATKKVITFKTAYVFNVAQIDGLKLKNAEEESFPPVAPLEAQNHVLDLYKDGPKVVYERMGKGESPYWLPSSDTIHLPESGQFKTPAHMFQTLMHELVHSTGHKDRNNRETVQKYSKSGGGPNEFAAREEVIAEMGAAILCENFGIDYELDNSAFYAAEYLKTLKDFPEEVDSLISIADKAAKRILGDWSPLKGYGPGNAVENKE